MRVPLVRDERAALVRRRAPDVGLAARGAFRRGALRDFAEFDFRDDWRALRGIMRSRLMLLRNEIQRRARCRRRFARLLHIRLPASGFGASDLASARTRW